MRLAASGIQTLHALSASCMQSRQFFASTLREQLFELKNEDPIKKSENLCYTYVCKGLSINTMHGPIQSRETVPLMYLSIFSFSTFLDNSYTVVKITSFRITKWA
jgi:hypothetical protein